MENLSYFVVEGDLPNFRKVFNTYYQKYCNFGKGCLSWAVNSIFHDIAKRQNVWRCGWKMASVK